MRKAFALVLAISTVGCTPAIQITDESKYFANNSTDNQTHSVESTALRFTLEDSTVTLALASQLKPSGGTQGQQVLQQQPAAGDDKSKARGAAAPAVRPAATQSPAPGSSQTVLVTCTDDAWTSCFNGAAPSALMAPPPTAGSSKREPDLGKVYVGAPHDSSNLWLTTTSLQGTAVTGQDTIYSQVTVKYTSNAATVISAAGTGAVAGFGIAGPAGAAVFGIGGAIASLVPAAAPGGLPVPAPPLKDIEPYLCQGQPNYNEPVDLSNLMSDGALTPTLNLPVTISGADARPFAGSSQLNRVDLPNGTNNACWHALPNASALTSGAVRVLDGSTPSNRSRTPTNGDGWLYRMVEEQDQLPNALSATSYMADDTVKPEFPYSACRKVMVQVTWWRTLSQAIGTATAGNAPSPTVINFETTVADPNLVTVARVRKGGVINFKTDCGANATANTDTGTGAIINAAITDVQNIYKSEQSYDSSKAGTTKK
jgi:hypothetical protein